MHVTHGITNKSSHNLSNPTGIQYTVEKTLPYYNISVIRQAVVTLFMFPDVV